MACHEFSNSFVRGEPLSPCVASLRGRYPGITQESREKSLPIGRSSWEKAFPLRPVPMVFLGQFDVFVSPHFVAAPCHRFFPVSAAFRIVRGNSPSAKQQTRTRLIAKVCTHGCLSFLSSHHSETEYVSCDQHSFGLLRKQQTRRNA